MKKIALAVAAICAIPGAASAATTITINAGTNVSSDTAVFATFGPGVYSVTPTNTVPGFVAFSRFSSNSGCSQLGDNCTQGYEFSYRIDVNGTTFATGLNGSNGGLGPVDGGYYGTQALAFRTTRGGAFGTSFTLLAPQSVAFYVFDPASGGDNRGGISLIVNQVAAVPEPATWAMMLVGFGMVGFGLRSRRTGKVSTRVSFT